jgi:hypothetical protein
MDCYLDVVHLRFEEARLLKIVQKKTIARDASWLRQQILNAEKDIIRCDAVESVGWNREHVRRLKQGKLLFFQTNRFHDLEDPNWTEAE